MATNLPRTQVLICEAFSNAANAWRAAVVNECGVDPGAPAASGLQHVPATELTLSTRHLHDAVKGILHWVKGEAAQKLVQHLASWRAAAAESDAALSLGVVARLLSEVERSLQGASDDHTSARRDEMRSVQRAILKSLQQMEKAIDAQQVRNKDLRKRDGKLRPSDELVLGALPASTGDPLKLQEHIVKALHPIAKSTVSASLKRLRKARLVSKNCLRRTKSGDRRVEG